MMNELGFSPADILIPQGIDLANWSVVACDQYTSEPEYWQRVQERTAGKASAFHLILPEAWLASETLPERISEVNATMARYLADGLFTRYENAYVYLEREVSGGIRRGLCGKLDLEQYDYRAGTQSLVRPTEGTVESRLPPRIQVRKSAPLESPHIMVLIDDPACQVIEPLAGQTAQMKQIYDFSLMERGGQIRGFVLEPAQQTAVDAALRSLVHPDEAHPLLFAVGDGNHSLATAKACWELCKPTLTEQERQTHPARFALVELVNLHDPAMQFEPIHRIVTGVDPAHLRRAFAERYTLGDGSHGGQPVVLLAGEKRETLYIENPSSGLAVGSLQSFLDDYQNEHGGEIDYIHGEEVVARLASVSNAVGFLLPAIEKGALFSTVQADGALCRKTFSMGHAYEKRYYLECREIR